MTANAISSAHLIQQQAPGFSPSVGIILGSGLHTFAEGLIQAQHIPYHTLPGFPAVTVAGMWGN